MRREFCRHCVQLIYPAMPEGYFKSLRPGGFAIDLASCRQPLHPRPGFGPFKRTLISIEINDRRALALANPHIGHSLSATLLKLCSGAGLAAETVLRGEALSWLGCRRDKVVLQNTTSIEAVWQALLADMGLTSPTPSAPPRYAGGRGSSGYGTRAETRKGRGKLRGANVTRRTDNSLHLQN
jgi:hypothetical protein